MQPLVDRGEQLLRQIQEWAAATGIDDLTAHELREGGRREGSGGLGGEVRRDRKPGSRGHGRNSTTRVSGAVHGRAPRRAGEGRTRHRRELRCDGVDVDIAYLEQPRTHKRADVRQRARSGAGPSREVQGAPPRANAVGDDAYCRSPVPATTGSRLVPDAGFTPTPSWMRFPGATGGAPLRQGQGMPGQKGGNPRPGRESVVRGHASTDVDYAVVEGPARVRIEKLIRAGMELLTPENYAEAVRSQRAPLLRGRTLMAVAVAAPPTPDETVSALIAQALADTDPYVRCYGLYAIQVLGWPALRAAAEGLRLDDPDPQVRRPRPRCSAWHKSDVVAMLTNGRLGDPPVGDLDVLGLGVVAHVPAVRLHGRHRR